MFSLLLSSSSSSLFIGNRVPGIPVGFAACSHVSSIDSFVSGSLQSSIVVLIVKCDLGIGHSSSSSSLLSLLFNFIFNSQVSRDSLASNFRFDGASEL